MATTRILLLDGDSAATDELQRVLAAEPRFVVVGSASTWWTAVGFTGDAQVDVCIVDVSSPDIDGAVATHRLKQANEDIRVIVLAEDHDLDSLERLLNAGINAFILKRRVATELIPAIHSVMQAGVYLGERHATDPYESREHRV